MHPSSRTKLLLASSCPSTWKNMASVGLFFFLERTSRCVIELKDNNKYIFSVKNNSIFYVYCTVHHCNS